MKKELKTEINALVKSAKVAFVSSIDDRGYPNTKAMLTLQHEGLLVHYFSTNLSARRSQQFLKEPRASIYFCDEEQYMGLMLIGNMQVLTDNEHKAMLWRDGFEIYYPDGVNTEDYCVLKFIAEQGNYYHGLENNDLGLEDLKNA